jgi:hypothetical protein
MKAGTSKSQGIQGEEAISHNALETSKKQVTSTPDDPSRRSFLQKAGGLTMVILGSAIVPLEPLLGGKESRAEASVIGYDSGTRAAASFDYREDQAENENINIGQLPDNGDSTNFTDFSGNFSKALIHDCLGVPDQQSWLSMKTALTSGQFTDFQNIMVGNPHHPFPTDPQWPNSHLNGPEASLAFDLEGLDSHATKIPPAPSVASAQTADEQVEHYWAALLRDVAFTDYGASTLAQQAAHDLNGLTYINSAANIEYPHPVTTANLFRGQIVPGDGNVQGPYLSQFLVQPFMIGQLPVTQKYLTFPAGIDYLTKPGFDQGGYQFVENGGQTPMPTTNPTPNYIRDGRDLASIPHNDPNYQEYYFAYLILSQIGPPSNPGAPPNPGVPYIGSTTQKPFGTFGAVDITATLAEVTSRAIKAAWFHKWIVNLRLRPEEYGALVQARLVPLTCIAPQASRALHPDVLNDPVLNLIFNKYGSYLLPQAYPEGCPTHPCYPTGHGTVAGACATVLKFFFDGSQQIRPLLQAAGSDIKVPTNDGSSLTTYDATDAGALTINGELVKLCFNVSFGHGIHAGIHFRSSTYYSILLGEQIALSVLQDRANSYFEPFTISITKFDGSTATITNPGNGQV